MAGVVSEGCWVRRMVLGGDKVRCSAGSMAIHVEHRTHNSVWSSVGQTCGCIGYMYMCAVVHLSVAA